MSDLMPCQIKASITEAIHEFNFAIERETNVLNLIELHRALRRLQKAQDEWHNVDPCSRCPRKRRRLCAAGVPLQRVRRLT